jgi:DNA-binding SARP family transcriptional activator
MSKLKIFLFGRLRAEIGEEKLKGLEAPKVQELLGYLLTHRSEPQPREMLAGQLWGDVDTAHSKKKLRQTLWSLQTALNGSEPPAQPLILADDDWVQFNPLADCWLDLAEFEQGYAAVQGVDAHQLSADQARCLVNSSALYCADLLEGWYTDWCLFERERLQNMYLHILEKLMIYSENRQAFEAGLSYAARILRFDRANERIHNCLMRLHYLSGDRTEALRQFERCTRALREELDVGPSKKTLVLYEMIRAEEPLTPAPALIPYTGEPKTSPLSSRAPAGGPALTDMLGQLRQFQATLVNVQSMVQNQIKLLESLLEERKKH